MSAQHDHFVGFITAANLSNRVVRSRTLRIDMVNDIELEYNVSAVVENATDAAEVFVAHHHCRNYFVDIERPVVESTNLAKLTTSVVDSNQRAILFQKCIELFVNLAIA